LRVYVRFVVALKQNECDILEWLSIHAPGLAPRILYKDFSKSVCTFGYIVEEFVEGKVCDTDRLDETLLTDMAVFLQKLHRVKPPPADSKDPVILPWQDLFTYTRGGLDAIRTAQMSQLLVDGERILTVHQQFMRDLPTNCISHGDSHTGNSLRRPSGDLFLLDWETSHAGHCAEDLACSITTHGYNEQQEARFLEAYGYGSSHLERKTLYLFKIRRLLSLVSYLPGLVDFLSTQRTDADATKKEQLLVGIDFYANSLKALLVKGVPEP